MAKVAVRAVVTVAALPGSKYRPNTSPAAQEVDRRSNHELKRRAMRAHRRGGYGYHCPPAFHAHNARLAEATFNSTPEYVCWASPLNC